MKPVYRNDSVEVERLLSLPTFHQLIVAQILELNDHLFHNVLLAEIVR
jgi:hypothetical protein